MYVGILTARFGDKSLEEMIKYAGANGFGGLEVASQHIDLDAVIADGGAAVKKMLDDNGVKISSIAHYAAFNRNSTPEKYQADMAKVMTAAQALGLDVVCALTGFPAEGKNKMQTIREVLPDVFAPVVKDAQSKNIKIAFENWFATNLQHLEHFKALTEALPQENVGFNFDPSHLHWQQTDYLAAIDEFKDRIFHTHAKDVQVKTHLRDRLGVLEVGWWRYCIPGFGEIPWGKYILALQEIGFDGVLSIEHEDGAFDAEPGFEAGLKYLSQYV